MQSSKPTGKPYANGTKFFQHKARLLYITNGSDAEELLVADYGICYRKKKQIENWPNFRFGKLVVVSALDKQYKNCKKRRLL